ncbi:hypothetical protein QAD02_011374 [Eretmocerus hayati]|uniref:Uncharacterized protein n=1 Tax=Eretmocerus hayati TaxID=131215 RepID=A0ACC2NXK6_9HYME|nr:hypothetical protein QAD02_011374 [Eretmocerus hayati]
MKIFIVISLSTLLGVTAYKDLTVGPIRQRRIFFGSNGAISALPFYAAIECYHFNTGGGSIISPKYVLTAAHLFDIFTDKDYFRVRSGSDERGSGGEEHALENYEKHPEYVSDDGAGGCVNDIALIKIEGTFTYNRVQRPIPIFKAGEVAEPGAKAIVIGFGYTEDGLPQHLKMTTLPLFDTNMCNETWFNRDGYPIPNKTICAGGGKDRRDSCDGDSGGALVVGGKLAGILSFGYSRRTQDYSIECGFEDIPSIYTEVAQFQSWIDNRINS